MTRDANPTRHCTVPKIFNIREWFEKNYGDLCVVHDTAYINKECRVCSDIKFVGEMIKLDWKTKKKNLFFSVPIALPLFIVFQINSLVDWFGRRL